MYFVYLSVMEYGTSNSDHKNIVFLDPLWRSVFTDLTQGVADADTT